MKRLLLVATLILSLMAVGGVAIAAGGDKYDHKAQHITLYTVETYWADVMADGTVLTDEDDDDGDGDGDGEPFQPGPGDLFTFTDTVYSDAERTNEVGLNTGSCMVTEVSGTFPDEEPEPGAELPDFAVRNICSGTLVLDDGIITWQGYFAFTDELFAEEPGTDVPFATLALTGGTGEYKRAGGEVSLFDETEDHEEGEEPDEVLNRYEITLFDFKPLHRH